MPSQSPNELTHIEDLIIAYGKLPTEANRTRIMHLINSEVLSVLDELEERAEDHTVAGDGDRSVHVRHIQTLKEKYNV